MAFLPFFEVSSSQSAVKEFLGLCLYKKLLQTIVTRAHRP